MPSLYDLTEKYNALFESALLDSSDNDGEISDDWLAVLNAIEDELETKLEGCVRVYFSLNAHADSLKREAARLAERAKQAADRVEHLKDYMKDELEKIAADKFDAGPFRLSICKNSQPSVEVIDIDLVPDAYDKVRDREIDKKLVLESHKIGLHVPGCKIERATHLRIK